MQPEDGDGRGPRSDRKGAGRLAVTLTNDLSEVPRLGAAVERFGMDHGIPIDAIDAVNIALDELVTNVIRYGHADGAAHQIAVRLALEADRLAIEVIDDGGPFDPLDRPSPDTTAPIEERRPGGLGIHFVRTLMDEVSYRRGAGSNTVSMVKHVHRQGKPAP